MIELSVSKQLKSGSQSMQLDLQLEIPEHQFVAISGPSGAGKSTLLRLLAGLSRPDRGHIQVGDTVWFDQKKRINVSPQKRRVGFVFQNYSLFPNMTVWENLAFAVRSRPFRVGRLPRAQCREIDEILELLGMSLFRDRYPSTLSGGQQQRVALGRAIVGRPRLLLLDEPLSALDSGMRYRLQDELVKIHQRYRITTVMVSHCPAEMYRLSDRIVVMETGRVVRDGAPANVITGHSLSNKLAFSGKVIDLRRMDAIVMARVDFGNQIGEVVVGEEDAAALRIGDTVLLTAKAFAPLLIKGSATRAARGLLPQPGVGCSLAAMEN